MCKQWISLESGEINKVAVYKNLNPWSLYWNSSSSTFDSSVKTNKHLLDISDEFESKFSLFLLRSKWKIKVVLLWGNNWMIRSKQIVQYICALKWNDSHIKYIISCQLYVYLSQTSSTTFEKTSINFTLLYHLLKKLVYYIVV